MEEFHYYNLSFKEVRGGLITHRDNIGDLNKQALLEGSCESNWPPDATLFVEGRNPTDYLFYPLAPWITVSKRVQLALENEKIHGIQFLPVRVEHKSGIVISGYAILNLLHIVPALDYEHTEWVTQKRENVPYPHLNIWKVVLLRRRIERYDIFRLAESKTDIFVSEKFKKCLYQNNAYVGFGFIPIPTYG